MFLRNSYLKLVTNGVTVIFTDGVHKESFYDFQSLAIPLSNFSGTVTFKIGGVTINAVTFTNEIKIASMVAGKNTDYYALPPTDKSALEDECGPPGDELAMTVEVANGGSTPVNFKVHFMSQFVAGTS